MNIKDVVKKYQDLRKESTNINQSIQQSAVEFYEQLSSISKFANELPDNISNRKNSIQQIITDIIGSVDKLQNELNLLNVDCSIQIHGLIIAQQIQKLKEEKYNAKQSNAKLVRQSHKQRKQSSVKDSKNRR